MPGVHPNDTWDKQLLDTLPYLHYDYEPGTKREYSNVGYCVLALALSRAKPFVDYIQNEILTPLDMLDTSFTVRPWTEGRVVRGYFLGEANTTGYVVRGFEHNFLLPAGGLMSTVSDLGKLMRFQLGAGPETILRHATLLSSYRTIVPSDADLRYGDGIGYAAVRNPDSHLTALGHGGLWRVGFVASYEFNPAARTGVILLSNTSYGRADYKPLVRRILSILDPGSPGGSGVPSAEEH
jgi:CubicO group peptidase (beta-lactamase class C family)